MAPGNPNHGQKVDLGEDAPVTRETAGVVPSESLAAESQNAGGEFAKNRDPHSENTSAPQLETRSGGDKLDSAPNSQTRDTDKLDSSYATSSTTTSGETTTSGGAGRAGGQQQQQSSAGTAPSYVDNLYTRDTSGPHGKNLTEGGDAFGDSNETDGISKAMRAEPGSIDDPSREAERRFQVNQTTATGGTNPTQHGITGETKYDALSSDTPA